MKKLLIYALALIALMISACALPPLTQQPASTPQPVSTPTLVRGDLTWEQSLLVSQLSQSTGVPTDEILVTDTEAVTWPDHCLGIVHMGAVCAQGEVPGFRFVFVAQDKEYEFHTSKDMTIIRPVESK
jgi:hypothetical protein